MLIDKDCALRDKEFHISGAEFWQRVQDNGQVVFEELFREFYPSLCLFASRLLGNSEVVKDIVADLFAKIWAEHEMVQQVQDMSTYLYIATRNRCLNYLEHEKVVMNHREAMLKVKDLESEESIYRPLYEAETVRMLMQAVNKLPAECKNVVLLSLQGQTTSEIADMLHISASAVSNQKARAIRLLKQQLPPLIWLSFCFAMQ